MSLEMAEEARLKYEREKKKQDMKVIKNLIGPVSVLIEKKRNELTSRLKEKKAHLKEVKDDKAQ